MAATGRSSRPRVPTDPTAARYHHGDLRPALVRAALEILEESGVGALSLRETARRVGVSHAAPYHHFADRDALVDAVAAEGFRLQRQAMQEARNKAPGDRLPGLRGFGLAYATFAESHPALFRLMYTRERPADDRDTELARAGAEAFRILEDGICQETGRSRDEARGIALLLWSSMHGLAMLWLDGQLRWLGGSGIVPVAGHLADTLAAMLAAVPGTLAPLPGTRKPRA